LPGCKQLAVIILNLCTHKAQVPGPLGHQSGAIEAISFCGEGEFAAVISITVLNTASHIRKGRMTLKQLARSADYIDANIWKGVYER